jgi:hypothetical protein
MVHAAMDELSFDKCRPRKHPAVPASAPTPRDMCCGCRRTLAEQRAKCGQCRGEAHLMCVSNSGDVWRCSRCSHQAP